MFKKFGVWSLIVAIMAVMVPVGDVFADELPVVSWSLETSSITEGADGESFNATIELTITPALSADVTTSFAGAGGFTTATKDDDYSFPDGQGFTLSAGETTAIVNVTIHGDNNIEDDETIGFLLNENAAYVRGDIITHVLTITNDDVLPIIESGSLTHEDAVDGVVEIPQNGTMTVSASVTYDDGTTTSSLPLDDVYFQFYNSPANGDGEVDMDSVLTEFDYEAGSYTFTLYDDRFLAGEEYALALVQPESEAAPLLGLLIVSVVAEAPPTLSFETSEVSFEEGENIIVKAVLSEAIDEDVTFELALTEDIHTATADEDYDGGFFNETITISKGNIEQNISIGGLDDELGEGNEVFTLALTNISDNAVGVDSTVEVTIGENELPVLGFVTDEASVYESFPGVYSVFVELSHTFGEDVFFKRNIKDAGTATKNIDYQWESTNPHTIPAGELTTSVDMSFTDDSDEEGDEWFMMKLRTNGLVNATLDEDVRYHTVSILDNDGEYAPERTGIDVLNGDKTDETIETDIDSEFTIYTEFAYSDGTTSSVGGIFDDLDFQFFTSEGVPMDMGVPDSGSALLTGQSYSAGRFIFEVPSQLHDDRDSLFIPGYTYYLAIIDTTSEDEIMDSIEVLINPLVSFSEETSEVDEDYGSGEGTEIAALTNHSDEDITFDFIVEGTATYNGDFSFVTSSRFTVTTSISIPAGAGTSFPIAFFDDLVDEADETIVITLTQATYDEDGTVLEIAPESHSITILDNDENNAPELADDIGLSDRNMQEGTFTSIPKDILDITFTDIDGNVLSYSVTNTVDSVATAVYDDELDLLLLNAISPGETVVTVTADDGNGGTLDESFTLTVTEVDTADPEDAGTTVTPTPNGGGIGILPNTAPSASVLSGAEVTVLVDTELTFDASDSKDAEGNIQFYFWDFGDGSEEVYAQEPTMTHTYTATGTFALAIRVRDSYGAEDTASITVTVVASEDEVPAKTTPGAGQETTPPSTGDTTGPGGSTTTPTGDTTSPAGTTTPPVDTIIPSGQETPAGVLEAEDVTSPTETDTTNEDISSDTISPETIEEVIEEPTDDGLPTWIRILFGSGAIAAIAGAGIAVNRVRRTIG